MISNARTSIGMTEYFGYAATDKAQDSRKLMVYCDDLLPMLSGDISATKMSSWASTKNNQGKTNKLKVNTTSYIECEWRDNTAGASQFPPDVRKGEQVIIYNFGDSDTWYWRSASRNEGQRRTETYRIAVNDTLENTTSLNDDNSYYLELDTRRDKHVVLQTSKSNGEKFRYRIAIDAVKNTVYIGDDDSNYIQIDSNIPSITLYNKAKSMIQLNSEDIIISCQGQILMQSRQSTIDINAKDNITVNTDNQLTVTSKSDMSLTSQAKLTVKSSAAMTMSSDATYSMTAAAAMTLTANPLSVNV